MSVCKCKVCPHLMESWEYAWLLTRTITGRESCASLQVSSTASCSSPPLRASLRDRANSSAAQQTHDKIDLFYSCTTKYKNGHSPSFKADIGRHSEVIITPERTVNITVNTSTYQERTRFVFPTLS